MIKSYIGRSNLEFREGVLERGTFQLHSKITMEGGQARNE